MPTRHEAHQLEQILTLSKSQARAPVPPLSSMRASEPSTAPSHGNVPPTPGIAYSPSLVDPTFSSPSSTGNQPVAAVLSKSTRTPTEHGTPSIHSPANGGGMTGWDSTGSTVRRELERGMEPWFGPGSEFGPSIAHVIGGQGGRTMIGSSLRYLNSSGGDGGGAGASEEHAGDDAAVPESEDESSSRLSSKRGSASTGGAADRSTSTIKSFTPTHLAQRTDTSTVARAAEADKNSTIDTSFDTTLSSHAGVSAGARRLTESIRTGTSSSGPSAGKSGGAPSSSLAAAAPPAIDINSLLAPLPNFTRKNFAISTAPKASPASAAAVPMPVVVGSAVTSACSTHTTSAASVDVSGSIRKVRPKPKARLRAMPTEGHDDPADADDPAPQPPRQAAQPPVAALAVANGGPSNSFESNHLPDAAKKTASKSTYSRKSAKNTVPVPPTRAKAAQIAREQTYKSRAVLSCTDDSDVEAVPAPDAGSGPAKEVIELRSSSPRSLQPLPPARISKGKGKAPSRTGADEHAPSEPTRADPIDMLTPREAASTARDSTTAAGRASPSSTKEKKKGVINARAPAEAFKKGSSSKVAPALALRRTSPSKLAASAPKRNSPTSTQEDSSSDPDATEPEADVIQVERRAPKNGKGKENVAEDRRDADKSSPLSPLFTQPDSPPPKGASTASRAAKKRPSVVVESDKDSDDDVPVSALAKRKASSASSGSVQRRPTHTKKRRLAVGSDDEADDEDDTAPAVSAPPAPVVEESRFRSPTKKGAVKAVKSKAASRSKKAASPPPASPPGDARGLEGQPTVAVLGDTTDAETTDGRSPAKRARTSAMGGKGKAALQAAGKDMSSKGKAKAVETDDEDAEGSEGADENVAPPPEPINAHSPAKPSPIKRVAAASSSKQIRHGTPFGSAAGAGGTSTPSFKIPRHVAPFKDSAGRGRAGSTGAGGVLIPPALGLAARPLSRVGSETPGSGVKLNTIVSRTAHLVVGGPASTPTAGFSGSNSQATPSPSTALKSRVLASGLSRRGIARTPLLSAIAPAPKRLAPAPVEKKRAKKGDLNPDDFSDGEWEEMEKERKRKERECDVWD